MWECAQQSINLLYYMTREHRTRLYMLYLGQATPWARMVTHLVITFQVFRTLPYATITSFRLDEPFTRISSFCYETIPCMMLNLCPDKMIRIQHHSFLESTLALEVADFLPPNANSTFFIEGGDSLFPWKVKLKTVSELILFLLEEAESKVPLWRYPSLSSLPPLRLLVESLLLRPQGSWLTSSSKK